MYKLTLEQEDYPYPTKTTFDILHLDDVLGYLNRGLWKNDYKFVSLVNTDSFYGKPENKNGLK